VDVPLRSSPRKSLSGLLRGESQQLRVEHARTSELWEIRTSECPADSPNVRVTKYGHHMDASESPTCQRTRHRAGPPSTGDYLHKNESAVGD